MNLEIPNRSHWLSIVSNLQKIIVELIVFSVFIGDVVPWYIFVPGVFLIILIPILQWRKKIFYIRNGMLISESGIIFQQMQEIPLNKITTIDSEQGLIYKIFNVCKLKVDSGAASAGKAELEIILTTTKALELKALLLSDAEPIIQSEESTPSTNLNSIKITLKDIVIYALTKSKLAWILGLSVVIGQLDMFISDEIVSKIENNLSALIDSVGSTLSNTPIVIVIVAIASILLIAYILATIISIILEIIKFYDFTLYKDNKKINIEYGLLTTRKYSIPLEKVQAIRMKQSLFQQYLGYYNLEVVAIGYGDESDKKITPILYPIASKLLIDSILGELFPELSVLPQVNMAPKRSLVKFIFKRTIITMIILAPICYAISLYRLYVSILVFLIITIWQIILGYINYRNTSLGIDSKVIVASGGSTKKLTYIIPQENVQSILFKQTPFQKRVELCKCNIDICTNTFGEVVSVNHIETSLFDTLENSLSI